MRKSCFSMIIANRFRVQKKLQRLIVEIITWMVSYGGITNIFKQTHICVKVHTSTCVYFSIPMCLYKTHTCTYTYIEGYKQQFRINDVLIPDWYSIDNLLNWTTIDTL